MGLSPRAVDDLSLWEFAACVEAWVASHTPADDRPMTRDQYDEAAALLARVEASATV